MNRPWVFVLWTGALFLFVATVDQALKRWALDLSHPVEWGGFTLYPYENRGILGGVFSDLDPWIIRIFFSVLFGYLLLAGFLLIHFLRHRAVPILKWGILVYLSGVLGNVWDRMVRGSVTDYLILESLGKDGMAFNFADLVVAVGFILIVTAIFREADVLWYEKNQRKGYWVEPKFQRGFGGLLLMVGFSHFLVIAVYSFVFLKVFIGGDSSLGIATPDQVIRDYLVGLMVLEGSALLLTFAVSVLFSHRLVGPLIALENYVQRIFRWEKMPAFRLRDSDELKERIESIAHVVARGASEAAPTQKPAE